MGLSPDHVPVKGVLHDLLRNGVILPYPEVGTQITVTFGCILGPPPPPLKTKKVREIVKKLWPLKPKKLSMWLSSPQLPNTYGLPTGGADYLTPGKQYTGKVVSYTTTKYPPVCYIELDK